MRLMNRINKIQYISDTDLLLIIIFLKLFFYVSWFSIKKIEKIYD